MGSRGVDLVVDADETQLVHHMPLSCFIQVRMWSHERAMSVAQARNSLKLRSRDSGTAVPPRPVSSRSQVCVCVLLSLYLCICVWMSACLCLGMCTLWRLYTHLTLLAVMSIRKHMPGVLGVDWLCFFPLCCFRPPPCPQRSRSPRSPRWRRVTQAEAAAQSRALAAHSPAPPTHGAGGATAYYDEQEGEGEGEGEGFTTDGGTSGQESGWEGGRAQPPPPPPPPPPPQVPATGAATAQARGRLDAAARGSGGRSAGGETWAGDMCCVGVLSILLLLSFLQP